jgi:photosystem II stability/assembly factor-like uncharacterized protein
MKTLFINPGTGIFLLITSIFFFPVKVSQAQTGWEWQNPLPHGNDLFAVDVIDGTHFAIGGDAGILSVTTDKGNTWITSTTGHPGRIMSIDFIDLTTGWAVGSEGAILKTTDGGQSWEDISIGKTWWESVDFIDQNMGWLTGGDKIFKSTDGGATWDQQLDGEDLWPEALQFFDENTGYAVTGYGILKTVDGGAHWTSKDFADHPLTDGYFINAQTGWVVGWAGLSSRSGAEIYKTIDGGENWLQQQSNTYTDLLSVRFTDEMNGCALGHSGIMVVTADGGQTWTETEIYEYGDYFSLDCQGPFMVTVSTFPYIFMSEDAGVTWVPLKSEATHHDLYSVEFINNEVGFVSGDYGAILKTTDGGKTWTNHGLDLLYTLKDIEMIDPTNGWIAGYVTGEAKMVHTTDGGESWWPFTPVDTYPLISTCFRGANLGWASGSLGVILKTTDGGTTWQQKTSNTDEFLMCIEFLTDETGYVCGTGGLIMKSTDGGDTWTPLDSPVNFTLNKIFFIDEDLGWIAGAGGTLLKTTDGGNTWNIIENPYDSDEFLSVFFTCPDTGWVCGYGGILLQTTDGGSSWSYEYLSYNRFSDIYMTAGNYGWIAGEDGYILHKTKAAASTGIDPLNQSKGLIPLTVFPNPSPGFVTVCYTLPDHGRMMIRITDLFGRLVDIPFNTIQTAGEHKITRYLSHLSPSVYILELLFYPEGSGIPYRSAGKLFLNP